MLITNNTTLLSPFRRSILSIRLILSFCASEIFLFSRIHEYCTHLDIDSSKLLYHFFESCFTQYNEQTICQILLKNFSETLSACTCARSIGNSCCSCLWVMIHFPWVVLYGEEVCDIKVFYHNPHNLPLHHHQYLSLEIYHL